MRVSDFSVPRRMSGSAYWVLMAKELREFAGPFVLLVIVNISGDKHTFSGKILLASLICAGYLVLAALMAFIDWYFKKYYIEGGKLVFMNGLLNKGITSIPLNKVQSMRTRQGFIYRVLELRGVLFDTLASKSAEVELILDDRDWKALMERVEMQEAAVEDKDSGAEAWTAAEAVTDADAGDVQGVPAGEAVDKDMATEGNPKEESAAGNAVRMNFSNSNLIKGAFCQNHLQGMAVLFAALAAVYNSVTTVDDRAVDHIIDYVDTHAGTLSLQPSGYVVVAVALYFFVMLLWIGKVFLRYANMEVRIARGQLTFESGLIARNSSRFSYDKVCTVYVKRNFLEHWMHGSTVMLRQALNATDDKKGADVRVYGSESAADFVMRLDILISLAAAVTLACFGLYVWLAVPAAWLLISLAKGLMAVRRSRITLKEDYIEIHNGKFADIRNYVKYSNIEVVCLKATPFTPYTCRVSLTLSTNGTSFTLLSLQEQEAREIYERLIFPRSGSFSSPVAMLEGTD